MNLSTNAWTFALMDITIAVEYASLAHSHVLNVLHLEILAFHA
jgi:hypothetical protein